MLGFTTKPPRLQLGEANVLQAIGDVQQFRDDRDAALASYQSALALYRQIGDRLGEANVYAARSRLLIESDPEAAQREREAALKLRRAIGDAYGEAADLGNFGIALLQLGRNQEARECLERARAIFAERGLHELLPQTDDLIAQASAEPGPPGDEDDAPHTE